MKANIHPTYVETQVTCTCGNTFTTRSTSPNGVLRADVCSACHPFYTGKQKILDTGGRVARLQERYAEKRERHQEPGTGRACSRRFARPAPSRLSEPGRARGLGSSDTSGGEPA